MQRTECDREVPLVEESNELALVTIRDRGSTRNQSMMRNRQHWACAAEAELS